MDRPFSLMPPILTGLYDAIRQQSSRAVNHETCSFEKRVNLFYPRAIESTDFVSSLLSWRFFGYIKTENNYLKMQNQDFPDGVLPALL